MTFDNPFLFFLCSLGAFNGFLVSIYFLFFAKHKRSQNTLFGLLVLVLSIRIGKSVYSLFSETKNSLILQVGMSVCLIIGVSLFYYLKASIENRKRIPITWKIHILSLSLLVIIVGFFKPYEMNMMFWKDFLLFIYAIWGLYLLASLFVLEKILKKLFFLKEECITAELWLIAVYFANFLIFIAYILGYYFLYLVGTITFSVVFYGLMIFFLYKKNRDTIFQDIPQKYNVRKIESKQADLLINRLDTLIKEKELYKKTEVKLPSIAKELKITPHKLSQLLNDNFGKSFTAFLNDYRIKEAKRLLKEQNKFTLENVGFESGFSSKSNFYATFKKKVGQTPAQYQKQFI